MKKMKPQIVTLFIIAMIFVFSFGCEKEYLLTTLSTNEVTKITEATAISGGNIVSDGGTNITAHGICWNTKSMPTIDSLKTIHNDSSHQFVDTLTNLTPGTIYYVRAYAVNKGGVAYGIEQTFETKGISVTTVDPTDILTHTAKSGGSIITEGTGESILSRGICYSFFSMPTKMNDTISAGYGKGSFTVDIKNLQKSTKYFIRAYASSKIGTYYGDVKQFMTNDGLAIVTTNPATNITNTTLSLGGDVKSDGGYSIIARGLVWSTNQNPTLNLSTYTVDGSGLGFFSSTITGLIAGAKYYVRTYATNVEGTAYGNQIQLTTTGMTDIDGNVYNTVNIGTQVWIVENLKTTRYNNGDIIGTITSLLNNRENEPKYQWAPNGEERNVSIYGRLYTWYAATDIRGICPKGWHLSTDNDWVILKNYVTENPGYSGNNAKALVAKTNWQYYSIYQAIWLNYWPDMTTNNSSGFTALPSGRCGFGYNDNSYNKFTDFGSTFYSWCYEGDFQVIGGGSNKLDLYGFTLNSVGMPVRCVKDK